MTLLLNEEDSLLEEKIQCPVLPAQVRRDSVSERMHNTYTHDGHWHSQEGSKGL